MKNKKIMLVLVSLITISLWGFWLPLRASAATNYFNQQYNNSRIYNYYDFYHNWSMGYPVNGDSLIIDPHKYGGPGSLSATLLGLDPPFTPSEICIQGYAIYTSTFTLNQNTLSTSNPFAQYWRHIKPEWHKPDIDVHQCPRGDHNRACGPGFTGGQANSRGQDHGDEEVGKNLLEV